MPLRLRLALFGVAVVALTLVIFGSLLYALVSRSVNSNQDDALRSRAHEALAALSASPALTARAPIAPADLRSSGDVFVEVFDPGWTVVYSTAELNGAPPMPSARLRVAVPEVFGGYFDTDGGFRYFGVQFAHGYVVTGQSTKVPQSNLSGIVGFLVISGIPTLLAALAASWLVAGRALRPLKLVAVAADDIGRTRDFARRLPTSRSRDEVAVLSASFNRMLSQLQDSFESQRRFVADASHELRTPLATILGNAGLLAHGPAIAEPVRRAAASDIAAESERMGRLVDRMLTLARADAGLRLDLAPLDLRSTVGDVTRQAAAVHPDMKFEVSTVDAAVAGDEDALRELLWILLDNALRYARSTITVDLEVDSGWARLIVGDDGPGIAVADRERVFERFYKADAARATSETVPGGHGAGLGLSIARWITEQHGGRIFAGSGKGGGAGIYVDLPLLRRS
ncbi:MAG: HAMP domain-containing histidine kinase [Chloroflexi bacterium]|nr:MAG: HAMP domain-containing histidine kinase [Chloroflexota bacterium]